MKKFLTVLCALILALTCVFALFTGVYAAGESEQTTKVADWFTNASNYANHYHGNFGGITVLDDGSVRVLAQKATNGKSKNTGFMLKKDAVKSLIDAGHEVISFKVTTEAYETNEQFGFVNIYASDLNPKEFHCYPENGTFSGGVNLIFASGSLVKIDLVKLYAAFRSADGLKFVMAKTATGGETVLPGYVVLSDFKSFKSIKTPVGQMASEDSYTSYANGEFGGVTEIDENSVQILAKEKNGKAGVMLTKKAIEALLLFRGNEMTVTLDAAAYNGGAAPKYVVLESPKAVEYVENYKTVAAKVDGNKLYFTPGTTVTIRLDKLYPYITAENSLKFALLRGDSWENGGSAAYLNLSDLAFTEKMETRKLDLVTSNGDFTGLYKGEESWEKMTEKTLRAAAAAGFKYIDLSLYELRDVSAPADKKTNGWEDDLMKDGWEDIITRIKAVAEDLGIEFRLSHSPGYAGFGSAEWVAVNKRSIDICKMLGIENLVVHSTVGSSKENCYTVNATHYAKILPYAAERGINILCENSTMKNVPAGKWFFTNGADMRGLIELVQSQGYSNFHGVWDTGHANCEGSQYLDILAMREEIYALHVNDNLANGDTHLALFYGNMDVDEVMRALQVIGFSGDFTLEVTGGKRIESTLTYTGPKLEGVENYHPTDRIEQEKLIYKTCTNILETYGCACEEHTLGEPVWRWLDNDVTAHLTVDCKNCGYRKVVDAEVTHKEGTLVYSATATYEGKTYTDVVTYYTVVFKNWDGTVLSTNLYRKGDKVKAPADPTRAKDSYYEYTFAGWDKKIADCAGDAVYTAVYNKKHYHTYTKKVTAPTCTEKGYTTYTCACKDTYKDNYVNAAGHKYPSLCDVKCTVCGIYKGHKYTHSCDRTCNDCGTSRTIQHTYKDACDAICDVCGVGRVAPHSYAAATCTKAKTCKCGATSGSALGHKYTNSCDTSCNTCGAKRTVTHSYEAATCTKAKTCKTCGATSGSALGHKYSNDCDATCNTCGAKRTVKHSYKTTTTKATLKKDGSTVNKCTKCGDVESKKTIKKVKTFKLSKTSFTYNGKTQKPSVTVKDSAGKTLKKGTDYTVTYAKGCKNVGTYKVTIKFIGKYSGTKTLTFKINPPKATLKKVTSLNDALKVTVNKKTTQVTGYQIQYSTSKSFTKATTKTIKSAKTTSLTLKKLKSNKKYFVRVRTFKTVDGTKFYSGWSSYKTAKTK